MMNLARPLGAFAIVTATLLSGCAINPVSGRPEAVLTTVEGEIEQGRKAAAEVERQMGFVDDAGLARYVDEIGQRLAALSQRPELDHEFHVVDSPVPNAFALPGGFVYVTRGLLVLTNDEAELVNVIGHEIGHVAARHSVSRQTASAPLVPLRILTGIGGAAASIVAPRVGTLIAGTGQLPGAIALAAYSREQEREADELGQQYAASAGWDPMGMSTFMKTLAREVELTGHDPSRRSFFDSHPTSPDRARDTRRFAEGLEVAIPAPIAGDRAAYLEKLVGLVIGDDGKGGVFIGSRFIHPEMGFAMDFPAEWEHTNMPDRVVSRTRDGRSAVVLFVEAEGDDPAGVADRFARENRMPSPPRAVAIGGLSAREGSFETGRRRDRTLVRVTFIACGGLIYRIAGITPSDQAASIEPLLKAAAHSFRVPTRAERDEVMVRELRVATAAAGESIEALQRRTRSVWEPQEFAVANGLDAEHVFAGGELVRIAFARPYVPTARPSGDAAGGEPSK